MIMKKILMIFVILSVILYNVYGFAGDLLFYVNDREAKAGSTLTISENDLERGMMVFVMPGHEQLNTVEISIDGGRIWSVMDKDDDDFIYRYRPITDTEMKVIFKAIGRRGIVLGRSPVVKVRYKNN